MIGKILGFNSEEKRQRRADEQHRNLIRMEAKIGGKLFGPIPKGHIREFFCLDEYTWVWHEEWRGANGQRQTLITRYDVRPDGVLKSQNGQYSKLSEKEALHLQKAVNLYITKTKTELYGSVLA